MDTVNRLRKYEPDKIALLLFFASGLLLAYLISSSRYSGPATAGKRLIRRIKQKGVSSFLDTESLRTFFLIKSNPKRAIGFSMQTYVDSNDMSGYQINSASMLYLPGRGGQEQLSYFRSDQRFDRLNWKSETAGALRSTGVELSLDESQNLSVRKLGLNGVERNYKLESLVIPDYLLDLVLVEMLRTGYSKIIVDILEYDGVITPALIQKMSQSGSDRDALGAADILKLELLDGRAYSQIVYFDGDGKIFKVILNQENTYIFERSSAEEVRSLFPEQAAFILETKKAQ